MTHGFVIATKPLTDEAWVPFSTGHLIVFRDGKAIFSETSLREAGGD
jgi:predicted glutamine amidotransferase